MQDEDGEWYSYLPAAPDWVNERFSECYGPEASDYVSSLLPAGSTVRLERDVTDTDRYGRLLRYVYLEDGRMLNELLLEGGYAKLYNSEDEEQYEQRLRAVEARARKAGAGLWTACDMDDEDESDGDDEVADGTSGDDCDDAYPDVCIASPPPNLNGADIEHRNIRVLQPDPHDVDADGDGFGCVS